MKRKKKIERHQVKKGDKNAAAKYDRNPELSGNVQVEKSLVLHITVLSLSLSLLTKIFLHLCWWLMTLILQRIITRASLWKHYTYNPSSSSSFSSEIYRIALLRIWSVKFPSMQFHATRIILCAANSLFQSYNEREREQRENYNVGFILFFYFFCFWSARMQFQPAHAHII